MKKLSNKSKYVKSWLTFDPRCAYCRRGDLHTHSQHRSSINAFNRKFETAKKQTRWSDAPLPLLCGYCNNGTLHTKKQHDAAVLRKRSSFSLANFNVEIRSIK